MFYFTVGCLFTFVRKRMMYIEFNSVTLFTILYLRFLNCTKDMSKVTAQPTILELCSKNLSRNYNRFLVDKHFLLLNYWFDLVIKLSLDTLSITSLYFMFIVKQA